MRYRAEISFQGGKVLDQVDLNAECEADALTAIEDMCAPAEYTVTSIEVLP